MRGPVVRKILSRRQGSIIHNVPASQVSLIFGPRERQKPDVLFLWRR